MNDYIATKIDLLKEIQKCKPGCAPSDIEIQAIKQISRANYKCNENYIEIEIEINKKRYCVTASNSLSCHDLRNRIYSCPTQEESLRHFFQATMLKEEMPLITVLKEYKENFLYSGATFQDELLFKFYGLEEPQDPLRKDYLIKWIDYEKQLENGNIIFDENNLYGIFAMTYVGLCESDTETLKKRYGDHILILKTLDQYIYFSDGIEIVGPKFEVIEKLDISKETGRLHLNTLVYNAFKVEKNKLQTKLKDEIEANKVMSERLNQLKLLVNKAQKHKTIGFLIGIICGIIITCLYYN